MLLWLTFLGAQATTWAGKFAVARLRPEFIDAVLAASPYFPSAHAIGAMAAYRFVVHAIAHDLPEREQRVEVAFWGGVLITTIGFSHIFLSVHYTTDVIAGFMVGGFWLLAGLALSEQARCCGPTQFAATHPPSSQPET